MRLRDRGMVKWVPFKSLPEQEEYLLMMEEDEAKIDKPSLSEDELYELNKTVLGLSKGDSIQITYYDHGFIKEIEGVLECVDDVYRRILLNNSVNISMDNVLKISVSI